MSFNGSGTFNINTAGQPVVTGTVISSSVFNALTADLATGLSTCITKDGQTTVTANIPMNSFKFTGLAAGTAATDSVRLGQLQAGAATLITVTGTNTYAGTMTPALSAYAAGNTFSFLVPNTNTTSCTLNIDGLGAKSITRDGTTALVAGDLVANSEVVVVYDGTQFQVLNSNSKTNFNLSGTLTVAGNTTLSGGTANQVQYLNASKVLSGSANLTFDGTTLTANALTTSSTVTINGGTANGVAYLNGSKVLTTGSALQFSGTYLQTLNGTGIQMQNAGATANWFFETSGLNLSFTSAQNGAAIWSINGSEQMRLTSTGLGIGTSSPGYKLDVNGAVKANGDGSGVGLYVNTAAIRYITNADCYIDYSFGGATGGLQFRCGASVAPVLTMSNAGNVTVNATSSGDGLTVSGNIALGSGNICGWATSAAYTIGANPNATVTSGGFVQFFGSTNGTPSLVNIGTNNATRIQTNATGNVTVFAPSSGESLTVNTVSGSGIRATAADLPRIATVSTGVNAVTVAMRSYDAGPFGIVGTMSNHSLNFRTNDIDRMVLDTAGNLLVGTTSASFNSSNSTFFYPTTGYWVVNHANGTSTGTRYIGFGYNTGEIGSITQNGTTGVLYNITSDYRLKEFVAPVTNAGERIDALNPVEFDWKSDGSRARGFFAHEFQQVYASSVTGEKDAVDEDGNPVYQKMQASTAEVIADLVAEIKSLRQRVAQLEVK